MGWWRHLLMLSVAAAITMAGLGFWIVFRNAIGNYLSREAAEPQQTAQPVQNPGVLTVKIINPPTAPVANPQCNKDHPCPAAPHE
ncbi:MAG TPA: hypothetical protein VGM17_18830 [Rhizomicrobium sp.]|jgi:hypothetical protein